MNLVKRLIEFVATSQRFKGGSNYIHQSFYHFNFENKSSHSTQHGHNNKNKNNNTTQPTTPPQGIKNEKNRNKGKE